MKVLTIILEPGWKTVSISRFRRLRLRNSCSESQRRALRAATLRERLMKTWPDSLDDTENGFHLLSFESSDFDFFTIGFISST